MESKTFSSLGGKNSFGRVRAFQLLLLSCLEVDLSFPCFLVSTAVRNGANALVYQQFMSFSEDGLSELLDLLEDEEDKRQIYVVTPVDGNPENGLNMQRLEELWLAGDVANPAMESLVYVLRDGRRFTRQRTRSAGNAANCNSRLLLRG